MLDNLNFTCFFVYSFILFPLDCINQFVMVKINHTASTVECSFINQSDISIKGCLIEYGQCGQTLDSFSQDNSTEQSPNHILLNVTAAKIDCYVVTASSSTYIVRVEGVENRRMDPGRLRLLVDLCISVIYIFLQI